VRPHLRPAEREEGALLVGGEDMGTPHSSQRIRSRRGRLQERGPRGTDERFEFSETCSTGSQKIKSVTRVDMRCTSAQDMETAPISRGQVVAILTPDVCIAAVENAFRLLEERSLARDPRPRRRRRIPREAGAAISTTRGSPPRSTRTFLNPQCPPRPFRLVARRRKRPPPAPDSAELTALRTAAARLSPPDTPVPTRRRRRSGCGRQAKAQLQALRRVLPIDRAFARPDVSSRALCARWRRSSM
jgi:hypothetical protein